MLRGKCPAYEKNKEEHALFMNILTYYKDRYRVSDEPKAMLERLHQNLVWWINNHIIQVDVQLKEQRKDVGKAKPTKTIG